MEGCWSARPNVAPTGRRRLPPSVLWSLWVSRRLHDVTALAGGIALPFTLCYLALFLPASVISVNLIFFLHLSCASVIHCSSAVNFSISPVGPHSFRSFFLPFPFSRSSSPGLVFLVPAGVHLQRTFIYHSCLNSTHQEKKRENIQLYSLISRFLSKILLRSCT